MCYIKTHTTLIQRLVENTFLTILKKKVTARCENIEYVGMKGSH